MSSEEWQEWVLETHSHHVELLEDWFFAQGALAVSLEDNADEPLLEPGPGETPVWQNVKVTALFAGDVDLEPIRAEIPDTLLAKNCVTALGSVFGWTIFRPFKWVLDCGFALAGQSLQTRLLLMFIWIRGWRLVRVRMRPQPCVWPRLTMQSEVASASLTTVAAQAF